MKNKTKNIDFKNEKRNGAWIKFFYSLTNLGISIPVAVVFNGIIAFYIVDVKKLPSTWFAALGIFCTIYSAVTKPLIGHMSDRTKSRFGRRIPYVKFTALPYVILFALIFFIPFDGKNQPLELLFTYGTLIVVWQTISSLLYTGYYGLLPEMFESYKDRTDVAAKMNIFQIMGLFTGVALTPVLGVKLGWELMAVIYSSVSAIALFLGIRVLFETNSSRNGEYLPMLDAFKAIYNNKSFITVAIFQALRFFGTGILTTGMMFYLKYSLKVNPSKASLIMGIVFGTAALMLYPWRQLVAVRTDSRTTLILANLVMIIGIFILGFGRTMAHAYPGAFIIGTGVSGLLLSGDVLTSEIIDEDHLKTGIQRAGIFFGMISICISCGSILVNVLFGYITNLFGYNPLLEVQPSTVDLGFRLFMTIPAGAGFLLSAIALIFYPLNRKKIEEIKSALNAKNDKLQDQNA
jgi:glycoside/pentoside/hexuronide:cation symporter, GPH family